MLRHNEEGRHTNDAPYFPGENFPLAPEAVRDAYQTYWRSIDESPEIIAEKEHEMTMVNTLISDFCDEYIKPPVYSAAMLGPIADDLDNPERADSAWRALRQYAGEYDEDVQFVLGVLADRPIMVRFWKNASKEQYREQPELLALLQQQEVSAVNDPAIWQAPARLISPDRMLDLLDNVNLESLLIRSVETLEFLDSPKAQQDSLTLRRIHQAESLLAPICEIIGFDGLAMALHSRTNILRAKHTDTLEPLMRAQVVIGERGDEHQVDSDVQSLFTAIFGENIHEQMIKHGAPHGIVIGEGLCTDQNLRVVWRLKSVGSLTRKLIREKNPEQNPMDILGATIVADDEHQLAVQLGRIIERSHDDGRIKLTPTVDRTDAVHVKGTADYIDIVRETLGFGSLEAMRRFVDVVEIQPGGHRVCKVTLVYRQEGRPDLNAEIQLTTVKDRVEARIGSAAHLLYKFAGTNEQAIEPEHLAEIRARKASLTAVGLVPVSQERADEMHRYFTERSE